MTVAGRAAAILLSIVVSSAACGKRGNPQAPLRPMPGHITDVSARRVGDRIELRFTIPAKNTDNTTPPAIERVDIYALVSASATPPTPAKVQEAANLKGHIEVRRPPDPSRPAAPVPPGAPPAPADTRPAPGEPARYSSTITVDRGAAPADAAATLNYLIVGVAGGRRTPSGVVAVPLAAIPETPRDVTLNYDEKTLTLAWHGSGVEEQFRVYDVDERGREKDRHPIGAAPLTTLMFTAPVEFGRPRCLAVHAVRLAGAASVESEAPPPVCVTPVDTFAPPAPIVRTPVPSPGSVNVTWDAVDAADIAGYFVLRAEGPDEKLQALMTEPLAATTYRDETTRPAVRYVYAVVAIDKAGNRSKESRRVEVVGR